MAKEFAKSFYNSKEWKACRSAYITKRINLDGGKCERCHDNVGYILHHKIELNPTNISNPDITLNHCNLEYVCKRCHDNIHFAELHGIKPSVCFDENGNIIPDRE